MIAFLIVGIILFVVGTVVLFNSLRINDEVTTSGLITAATWGMGLLLVGIFMGTTYNISDTSEIIFPEDITYKSVDAQDAEYYIVDKDGNIYEITQEQWANLDVPIVPNTEK